MPCVGLRTLPKVGRSLLKGAVGDLLAEYGFAHEARSITDIPPRDLQSSHREFTT